MTDDLLVYRAERIKSGQNVHRLNSLLCAYEIAKELATDDDCDEVRFIFLELRRSLLQIIITAENNLFLSTSLQADGLDLSL